VSSEFEKEERKKKKKGTEERRERKEKKEGEPNPNSETKNQISNYKTKNTKRLVFLLSNPCWCKMRNLFLFGP
jgi:hypothetical protein